MNLGIPSFQGLHNTRPSRSSPNFMQIGPKIPKLACWGGLGGAGGVGGIEGMESQKNTSDLKVFVESSLQFKFQPSSSRRLGKKTIAKIKPAKLTHTCQKLTEKR